jgi:hypothetical protein
MTTGQTLAYRLRWVMLIAAVLCLAVWIAWVFALPIFGWLVDKPAGFLGTPLIFFDIDSSTNYVHAAGLCGVLLLTQWAFLRPRGNWSMRLADHSRPLWTSIIAAAFIAMLLSIGAIAIVMEIPDWWAQMADNLQLLLWPVWIAMAVLWIIWIVVFALYWRSGDRYTQLTRMVRGLIAGSVLEMLVAAPVQAMCYDRGKDCYCSRGSYTGLVLGGTALIWAFGPGVVLLFLREKYRRQKLLTAAPDSA